MKIAEAPHRKFLDEHWQEIEDKVLIPLWNTYEIKYKEVGLEYGDFYSIAYIILERESAKFNLERASFYTFAKTVLKKRMYSYIRSISERDKTRASIYHESLDAPMAENNGVLLGDTIAAPELEDNTELDKIREYLSKLSKVQKDILIYHMLGFDKEDIIHDGGMSEKQYQFAVGSMQLHEKTSMFNVRRKF